MVQSHLQIKPFKTLSLAVSEVKLHQKYRLQCRWRFQKLGSLLEGEEVVDQSRRKKMVDVLCGISLRQFASTGQSLRKFCKKKI